MRSDSHKSAIMEKAQNIVAVPFSAGWSDLGGWDAVLNGSKLDDRGVAVSENAHSIDCQNSLLRSESSSQQIVGLGLKDIIAVAMPDAVLVADKKRAGSRRSGFSHWKCHIGETSRGEHSRGQMGGERPRECFSYGQ